MNCPLLSSLKRRRLRNTKKMTTEEMAIVPTNPPATTAAIVVPEKVVVDGEVLAASAGDVAEGTGCTVEEGESELRQVASLVAPTTLTSDTPPSLPLASDITKTTDVPDFTLAVHSNCARPFCGERVVALPPGIIAYAKTGSVLSGRTSRSPTRLTIIFTGCTAVE